MSEYVLIYIYDNIIAFHRNIEFGFDDNNNKALHFVLLLRYKSYDRSDECIHTSESCQFLCMPYPELGACNLVWKIFFLLFLLLNYCFGNNQLLFFFSFEKFLNLSCRGFCSWLYDKFGSLQQTVCWHMFT